MPQHSILAFDKLHKAKVNAGLNIDKPLAPEGSGDMYWAEDIETLSISDGAGGWLDYDLSSAGSGGTLAALSDTTISTPQDGDFIQYSNGSATWENTQLVITDISDVSITSLQDNDVLQYNNFTGNWENVQFSASVNVLNDIGNVTYTPALTDTGAVLTYNSLNDEWSTINAGSAQSGQVLTFNPFAQGSAAWTDLPVTSIDFDVILTDTSGDILVDAQGNILHI